ncbi:MAG TPA: DNA adenine methylase [Candidatus Absconditabacterales bacterium]|nr:DNA adenine methylase [Candidatus Absconditabacterales bacterium]
MIVLKEIKSPLRYPGGKSKAMKFLSRFAGKFKELREPFFGGGSFSLYYANREPNIKIVARDINYDLICFWLELKNNPINFINKVNEIKRTTKDGKKLYTEICDRRNLELSDFQRAVDFFVLNRITFSGTIDSGGYSNQSFLNRFTQSSIDRLMSVSELIQTIHFVHGDYERDLLDDGEDVLIFLDPPYYSATKSKLYGKNGDLHYGFNHYRFFETITKTKHRRIITYDNSDYIRDLYKDYYQIPWELSYGMTNYKNTECKIGKELLISNFPLESHISL